VTRADRVDDPREVRPRDHRERRGLVAALPEVGVDGVDSGGLDRHPNLLGTGIGPLDVVDSQDGRSAAFVVSDGSRTGV